jgi:hypothetical protein
LASASDDTLLEVSNAACEGCSEQNLGLGRVAQGFVEPDPTRI